MALLIGEMPLEPSKQFKLPIASQKIHISEPFWCSRFTLKKLSNLNLGVKSCQNHRYILRKYPFSYIPRLCFCCSLLPPSKENLLSEPTHAEKSGYKYWKNYIESELNADYFRFGQHYGQ